MHSKSIFPSSDLVLVCVSHQERATPHLSQTSEVISVAFSDVSASATAGAHTMQRHQSGSRPALTGVRWVGGWGCNSLWHL